LIVEDEVDKMEEVKDQLLRSLPDLVVLTVTALTQFAGMWWMLRRLSAKPSRTTRGVVLSALVFSLVFLIFGFLVRFGSVNRHLPMWLPSWGRGLVIAYALCSVAWIAVIVATESVVAWYSSHHPSRRQFLRTAQVVLLGAPVAAIGYGTFIQRKSIRLREERVPIPGLPASLDGLRIVQLTDIHRSPFLSREDLDHAVAMANETRPHLAVLTGDLITTGRDPLDSCLDSLAALRTDAGVFGCLGNHEAYANAEVHATREAARRGMHFLRAAATSLRFGDATLNLAGVDYQRFGRPYLRRAAGLVAPGAFNVLLSHNPDVFPVAAGQGYNLTLAGHTHGGQVRVEILSADLNVARFFTPYVDGLYREGASSIFVSRGIGTIGLPTRLGAPPEVALIQLCQT